MLGIVDRTTCERLGVLPISRAGRHLIVAMPDPAAGDVIRELADATGFHIEPVIAPLDAIEAAIRRYYG